MAPAAATPVTTPLPETVATDGLLDAQLIGIPLSGAPFFPITDTASPLDWPVVSVSAVGLTVTL